MQEVDGLGEEEEGVDEDNLDLVQQAGLGNRVEDHAVAGDERRREDGVLLLLSPQFLTAEVARYTSSSIGINTSSSSRTAVPRDDTM